MRSEREKLVIFLSCSFPFSISLLLWAWNPKLTKSLARIFFWWWEWIRMLICIDLFFFPPQFLNILAIFLDSVSGSIAQGMPYLQLLLLRRAQEKFSFMMVEEITSHFIFLTNSIRHLLLRYGWMQFTKQ